ncbi:hypothetical protein [Peribacillus huizhouensis]|uniref:Protein kinase domain-containing protein n=1 Tax=Peribacillus huizhouensis TaxID=1501239 RepID=A0ABR6CQB5_9BACI|nr:hypothetical protein [Peribacillus huizhouensis]MBA9027129.1 hypothetical protein [Peribacillus huizhouensis]
MPSLNINHNKKFLFPYFPSLTEAGSNYLVIDYIEGETLFECLKKGIPISEDQVKEVDRAL